MEVNFIDKLTNMDELLKEILVAIRGSNVEGKGMGVSQLVRMAKEEQVRTKKIIFFTYPYDGTQVTLAAGTTEIDFKAGTVKDTSGAVTNLQHSLNSEAKDFLRSLYINTDKAIKVQLDTGDVIFCDAEKDLQATYMEFTKCKITTTETTYLSLLACTNPEAILTLVDKASAISGGTRLVEATIVEETGTAATFKTDQVFMTDQPTLYLPVLPGTTQKVRINTLRFYLSPANAVTFQLYLLKHDTDPGTEPLQAREDLIYDSGAAMAKDTQYFVIAGGMVPIELHLGDTSKLYYMIDWSAAPGDTTGFITATGDKLA